LLHSRTLLFGQVGCGEGGCGACTVQIRFPGQSVPVLANACLRPVCSLDGAGEPHHPTVLCAIRCRVGCLQTDQRTVMPTLHGVCPGPYGRNANGRRLALLEPGRKRCRSGAAVPPLCFRGDDGGGRRDRRTAACIANPARRMRRLAVRILLSWHDHDDGTYLRATPLRAAFLDRSVVASSSLRLGRVVLHTQRRGRRWAGRPVGALPVGLRGRHCPMDSVRATVAYVPLRAQFGLLSRTASKPSKAQAPPLAWHRPMCLVMRVYARACSACGLAHVCLFLSCAGGQRALMRLCVFVARACAHHSWRIRRPHG
jgi:hypothetical protein